MRKILFILITLGLLWSCDKDEPVFDIETPSEGIVFEAIPGGA